MDDNKDKAKQLKDNLKKIIGKNIRKEREARKLSREELAVLIDFTSSHISLIETGKRGATLITLLQLSNIFDVPINNFFQKEDDCKNTPQKEYENKIRAKREKIATLASGLNDKELEHVINIIKENCRNKKR